jgi:hypothetical protein
MVKNNFIPGRASWLPRNFTMNLIFAYILLIFSNTLAAQVIKKSNQSISFMASVHADDNFPEVLGKSIDFMYERRPIHKS